MNAVREARTAEEYYGTAEEQGVDDVTEQLAELVRSGGYPYIKITVVDPESGAVEIMHHGLREDVDLPAAFRQLADLIEAEQEAARG